jgi:nucleotide-binding universal stress UspA family protein
MITSERSFRQMNSATPAQSPARKRVGNIVVTTDFSSESLKALSYAAALLRPGEGTLHLVHVLDIDYSYAVPSLLMAEPIVTAPEIGRAHEAELKKLAAKFVGPDIQPHVHVKVGRAFDQICEVAREVDADLIVIATHGRTGWKHLVLGSTAERVVQYAPCPVLVVRNEERDPFDTASASAPVRLQKILVPVDFSECAKHGVHYALALARRHGAKLVLLHCVQVQAMLPTEHYEAFARTPSPGVIERAAKQQMRRFVRGLETGDVAIETVFQIGRAAEQICNYAESQQVDVIVTSTHGLTGFAHVLIGSTAEHVVRYARSPVLVIPRRDRAARANGSL